MAICYTHHSKFIYQHMHQILSVCIDIRQRECYSKHQEIYFKEKEVLTNE